MKIKSKTFIILILSFLMIILFTACVSDDINNDIDNDTNTNTGTNDGTNTGTNDGTNTGTNDGTNTGTNDDTNSGNNSGTNNKNNYIVTFDSQGGTLVEAIEVNSGSLISYPNVPVFEGHLFLGWYKSEDFVEKWEFASDTVTSDITLFAYWLEISSLNEPESSTESLTYILENGTYTVTGVGEDVDIIIPTIYNGIAVTKIGNNPISKRGAFAGSNIKSITIPDSVTEIALNAFNNASSLEIVNISENSLLSLIGNNVFSGNSSLKSFYIPSKVVNIGTSVFNNCSSLETINVSSENTHYYSENGYLIDKVTSTLLRGTNNTHSGDDLSIIPEGVKRIENAAFRRSTITKVSLPESLIEIGNYAFDDCLDLLSFSVSENNSEYSSLNGILYNKNQTEIIIVPDALSGDIVLSTALTKISLMAFDGRSNITSITIPNTVISIGALAFRGLNSNIYYDDTEEKWNLISKNSSWDSGANLTINYKEINSSNSVLVVYFSYSNNTERVAEYVASSSGGKLVEIIPAIPYTSEDVNYNNTNSRSQVERRQNARPDIAIETYNNIDISEYDTIFIGYPIWNGYEPMIIRTFIEYYNGLSGKTIYTFSTSASSGGSSAFNSIKALCPSADVKDNCHIPSLGLQNASDIVNTWISGMDLVTNEVTDDELKIKLSFSNNEIIVNLIDNSATQDLLSRLEEGELTLSFSDFGGSEKIAYPNPALDVSDTEGCDPSIGDLTIYVPWGNLAIFYADSSGYSNSLVKLGTMSESGTALLASQTSAFQVIISLVK